jgi:hypothetical protein
MDWKSTVTLIALSPLGWLCRGPRRPVLSRPGAAAVRYAVSGETVLTRSEGFAPAVEIGPQEWYTGLGGVLSNALILLNMRMQAAILAFPSIAQKLLLFS